MLEGVRLGLHLAHVLLHRGVLRQHGAFHLRRVRVRVRARARARVRVRVRARVRLALGIGFGLGSVRRQHGAHHLAPRRHRPLGHRRVAHLP